MSNLVRAEVLSHTASAIAAVCQLTDEARHLLRADLMPPDFFKLLRDRHLDADALRFLALALPKRCAVWWGCLAAWQVARDDPPPVVAAALKSALRWVTQPSEDNRRAAEKPGRQAGLESPAGCLALAAFWSSGSMAPPELPAVPVAPYLTGRLSGNALLLAAVQRDPLQYRVRYRQFLQLGVEVAQGLNLWGEVDFSAVDHLEEDDSQIVSRVEAERSPVVQRNNGYQTVPFAPADGSPTAVG